MNTDSMAVEAMLILEPRKGVCNRHQGTFKLPPCHPYNSTC